MSRTLPGGMATAAALDITRPFWIVDIGFATPLRLSSRGAMTVGGNVYAAAQMTVDVDSRRQTGTIALFNDGYTIPTTARIAVAVYMGYGVDVTAFSALEQIHDGVLGGVAVATDQIRLALQPHAPKFMPRQRVRPPIFNHLPPPGTEFVTPNGVFVLEHAQ